MENSQKLDLKIQKITSKSFNHFVQLNLQQTIEIEIKLSEYDLIYLQKLIKEQNHDPILIDDDDKNNDDLDVKSFINFLSEKHLTIFMFTIFKFSQQEFELPQINSIQNYINKFLQLNQKKNPDQQQTEQILTQFIEFMYIKKDPNYHTKLLKQILSYPTELIQNNPYHIILLLNYLYTKADDQNLENILQIIQNNFENDKQLQKIHLVQTLTNKSIHLRSQGQQELSVKLLENAHEIIKNVQENSEKSSNFYKNVEYFEIINRINVGHCYQDFQDLDKAYEYCRQSYELAQGFKTDLPELISQILNNSASVLQQQGKIDAALEKYLQALRINEKIHMDKVGNVKNLSFNSELAVNLTNISGVYRELENFDESLKFANQALDTFRNLQKLKPKLFSSQLATSLANIAVTHQCMGDLEKALKYSLEAYEMFQKVNPISLDISLQLFNISSQYECLDNVEKAIQYGTKSLNVLKEFLGKDKISQHQNACDILEHLGNLHTINEDTDIALNYFLDSFDIREHQPPCDELILLANNISLLYQQKSDFPESRYFTEYAMETERKVGGK